MVTGEPGSGKTTLGLRLASFLRLPFVSRDSVRGGLLATSGLWTNQLSAPPPREAAVDAFVEVVETAARLGISSVVEFVVTPQRVDALHRLEAAARCLVIVAAARDAAARAEHRDRADPMLSRPEVLEALGHRSVDDYLQAPERELVRRTMYKDFELPLLRVATDDGYEPALETIVDWIIDQTRG
jgi:predicted kinase